MQRDNPAPSVHQTCADRHPSIAFFGAMMCLAAALCFSIRADERLRREITEAIRHNRMPGADSLFTALQSAGRLGAMDLLQWAEVSEALGRYSASARLLCRARAGDAGLDRLIQTRLFSLLKDSPPDTIGRVMGLFQTECLNTVADTVGIRRSVARTWSLLGYPDEQARVLVELETSGSPVGQELYDLSTSLLARGDLRRARTTGIRAFERLDASRRSEAAYLLFRVHSQTGPNDSTLLWLSRVSPLSGEKLQAAIVFYQWAGRLPGADSLIATLGPSINRDTLLIRQRLFEGRIGEAVKLVDRIGTQPHWTSGRLEHLYWKARTHLFARETKTAVQLFDSLAAFAQWGQVQPVLEYRYGLELAGAHVGMLGRVELAVYTGVPQQARKLIDTTSIDRRLRAYLALRIAQAFLERYLPVEAVATLEKHGDASPEIRFCLARALIAAGQTNQGRRVLEQLMIEHPDDIFAGKARLIIAGLKGT